MRRETSGNPDAPSGRPDGGPGVQREVSLIDARSIAERDPAFVAAERMRGTPEVAAIAREHLAVCFSCVLRNVSVHEAAALLLVEAYGLPSRKRERSSSAASRR